MANLIKDVIKNKGYMRGTKAWAVNAASGPQMGWMIDIANVISATMYINHDVFPFLLQYPKAYDLYDRETRDSLIRMEKTLLETAPKSIEGLRSTISTEWAQNEVGFAGEITQEITNVKRERSAPTYNYVELEGCPINRYLEWRIENLLMSADTNFPNIITEGFKIDTLLADMTRSVVCYVEPDRTGQFCVDAYLCANMAPMSAGERVSSRNGTAAKQNREMSIEWTATTQRGYGVIALGQALLDEINFTNANPQFQPAAVDFTDANIQAQDGGTKDQIHRLASGKINV